MSDLIDIADSWSGPHSATESPFSPFYRRGSVRTNPVEKESMPRARLLEAGAMATDPRKLRELEAWLDALATRMGEGRGTYGYFARRLISLLNNDHALAQEVAKLGVPVSGNMKLPFAAWSEMPVITCPGAGGVKPGVISEYGATSPTKVPGCAEWCYSLKGLRNPSVWYSRMRNTIAMTKGLAFPAIETAVRRIVAANRKKGKKTVLRIYVDGDFRSEKVIRGWMEVLGRLEDLTDFVAYGYSKSWKEFLALEDKIRWPRNYRLNVSSGSRHPKSLESRMMEHPVARGRFMAIDPIASLEEKFGPQAKWPAEVVADVAEWHRLTSAEKMPGMVAQAATYHLLRKYIAGGKVMACPISCSTCPLPMLGSSQAKNLEEIRKIAAGGAYAPERAPKIAGSHLCFSAQGRDIIIGLH